MNDIALVQILHALADLRRKEQQLVEDVVVLDALKKQVNILDRWRKKRVTYYLTRRHTKREPVTVVLWYFSYLTIELEKCQSMTGTSTSLNGPRQLPKVYTAYPSFRDCKNFFWRWLVRSEATNQKRAQSWSRSHYSHRDSTETLRDCDEFNWTRVNICYDVASYKNWLIEGPILTRWTSVARRPYKYSLKTIAKTRNVSPRDQASL